MTNKFKTKAMFAILCLAFSCITAQAKEITVTASKPRNFKERIDVYFDGDPYAMTKDNGYTLIIDLPEKEYKILALSQSDIGNFYTFSYPQTFDASKESTFNIDVGFNESADVVETDPHEEINEDVGIVEYVVQTMDLSDGREAGTLHVKCRDYMVFDSVKLTLVGDEMYTIDLNKENNFELNVLLPVGDYYESTSFEYTMSEGMTPKNDMQFLWQHATKTGQFGNYYHINAGETAELSDLVIYATLYNSSVELDPNIIMSGKTAEMDEKQREVHAQEVKRKLEEEFPDVYVQETLPSAEETTEAVQTQVETQGFNYMIIVKIVSLVAIGVILLLLIIKGLRKIQESRSAND